MSNRKPSPGHDRRRHRKSAPLPVVNPGLLPVRRTVEIEGQIYHAAHIVSAEVETAPLCERERVVAGGEANRWPHPAARKWVGI